MKNAVITNSKGDPIKLTQAEEFHARYIQRQINERFGNSLGAEVSITTLTQIVKKVSEQKFYEIPFADYMPVRVGEGAWSSNMLTYRSFDIAADFETGIINTGSQSARLAVADAGVDAVPIKIYNWAKSISWSIPEIQEASKSGNWDLVTSKEKARKRNWDLGLQKIAFLGMVGQNGSSGSCLGLLNQPGVTVNTTVITKAISSMTTAELTTFTEQVVEAYRANVNRTAFPTHFAVPESDYNGMARMSSPDFPIKSTLEILEEMFQVTCRNKQFKILPSAYGDLAYHADAPTIVGKQVYVLYRYDDESGRMDVPVDYTNTLANSINNFQFENAGYGQLTGFLAYRPLEFLYFQY